MPRKIPLLLAAATLLLPPINPAQTKQSSTSDSIQSPSDQPISLADAARLARANKPASAKPARLIDDDNMPRKSYPIDDKPATASTSANGQGASLTEFKGKVVLLDFWATWCGPCRRSLPSVKKLQAMYGSDQFVLVSVSEDENEPAWRSFVSANQMSWAQRFDSDNSFKQRFSVNALPTYVLVGRDGNVVNRYEGEDPAESIVERISPDLRQALAAK
jgi:thiol-disulfide isomerase/thioredoxin